MAHERYSIESFARNAIGNSSHPSRNGTVEVGMDIILN